jgi:hypothetical protein
MPHGQIYGPSQTSAMVCPLHAKDVEMNGGCPVCGTCPHQEQVKK